MRIAVIGTGRVGSVLGRRWARAGHTVVFGSRRPDSASVRELLDDAGSAASAASPAEATAQADVVVLAVPGSGAEEVAVSLGDLAGKILVDCTNPIVAGGGGLSVGFDDSGAERIARVVPGARVVKAFNTTGSANMADPIYPSGPLSMFVCGDDPEARAVVSELAEELGFDAVDSGPLRSARYVEPLAMLWITLAYPLGNGPDVGLALIRRG